MSLTNILAISESVGINDQRLIGQMLSRNLRISTSEILTVIPFQFTMKPMNYLLYSQSREILNSLRIPDKSFIQYLNFASTGWVNYIWYQGDMTSGQISASQWQTSSTGKNLVLGNLPSNAVMTPDKYIVKAGDFCQVNLYTYIATANVLRGSSATVTIPVHRVLMAPIISATNAVIGQNGTTVSMGGNTYTGCTFPVILKEYPRYTLVPMTNDSFIQWDGEFVAFEAVL